MRIYLYLAAVGIVLTAAGFTLLVQASALALETISEPLASASPIEVPYMLDFYQAWGRSAHASAGVEAFHHRDENGEVPVECAKCHSTSGYQDFLGVDGSDFGSVDSPTSAAAVITCDACHNRVAAEMTTVMFPSGAEIIDDSGSARCMQCHQGRASTDQVNAALEEVGLAEDLNTASPNLGFINVHYYAAAASLYGAEARGGYQYEGMVYHPRNSHVDAFNACADCHSPHTLEVRVAACAECHEGMKSVEDLRDIRLEAEGETAIDYDGDGDDSEPIAAEIASFQESLLAGIQAYAVQTVGTAIVYDSFTSPNWFIDTNENGTADPDEANRDNRYIQWTPNLLRAAYNYQYSVKDPGAYAHNPDYLLQVLYDSLQAIGSETTAIYTRPPVQ